MTESFSNRLRRVLFVVAHPVWAGPMCPVGGKGVFLVSGTGGLAPFRYIVFSADEARCHLVAGIENTACTKQFESWNDSTTRIPSLYTLTISQTQERSWGPSISTRNVLRGLAADF